MKKVKLFSAKTGVYIATVEVETGVKGDFETFTLLSGENAVAQYDPKEVVAINEDAIVEQDLGYSARLRERWVKMLGAKLEMADYDKLVAEADEAARAFTDALSGCIGGGATKQSEPLDLTKILEAGDVVCTDADGDVAITLVDDSEDARRTPYVIRGDSKKYASLSFDRKGWYNAERKSERRLKPKNGKTWAEFAAEKKARKEQKLEIPHFDTVIGLAKNWLKSRTEDKLLLTIRFEKSQKGGYVVSSSSCEAL